MVASGGAGLYAAGDAPAVWFADLSNTNEQSVWVLGGDDE